MRVFAQLVGVALLVGLVLKLILYAPQLGT
jgi:hypothetical protein